MRVLVAFFACCLLVGCIACTRIKLTSSNNSSEDAGITYTEIELGKTYTDISVTVSFLTHRIDMLAPDYERKSWDEYLAEFNALYPKIVIKTEGLTDYSANCFSRIFESDIMMMPSVDKSLYSKYFVPFGTLDEMKSLVRYCDGFAYDGVVYGLASAGCLHGMIYNKRVFERSGVKELPKTPEEYLEVLRLIKKNTDAVPLYINYAASWPLGAWDEYIANSVGDSSYMYSILPHQKNPLTETIPDAGLYNIYKILYDAVSEGLVEDYMRSDWEASKGMLNRGEIGTMALGSWAIVQMQGREVHPDDVGYMPFPITVYGKQYSSTGPDHAFAINKDISADKKKAAMIFIKWMIEKSDFAYNEGEIPSFIPDTHYAPIYQTFDFANIIPENVIIQGLEYEKNMLDLDSGLRFACNGGLKIQNLVDHAHRHDKTFDEIMDDWNKVWSAAQEDHHFYTWE